MAVIGGCVLGVIRTRALPFEVCIVAPEFLKLPYINGLGSAESAVAAGAAASSFEHVCCRRFNTYKYRVPYS